MILIPFNGSPIRFSLIASVPALMKNTGGAGPGAIFAGEDGGGGGGGGDGVVVVVVVAVGFGRLPPIFTMPLYGSPDPPEPPNVSFVCTYFSS